MRSPSIPAIPLRPSVPTLTVLIAALSALSALSGCTSTRVAQAPTVTLTFRTADLGSERGVRVIYRRIERAALQVCPEYDPLNLRGTSLSLVCQRRAIADAVRQIGDPRLATINSAMPSPQG
jgi:UrcA family protein